jgi:hypothetical protein
MDLNTVGIFFNVLEKATKNNLFDTSWNIDNIDESGIKRNNENDSVTADKGSKNVHISRRSYDN